MVSVLAIRPNVRGFNPVSDVDTTSLISEMSPMALIRGSKHIRNVGQLYETIWRNIISTIGAVRT
jgi:hypothetical protein